VAKVRAVVAVAKPESEDHWLEVARTKPYRVVYAMVKAELHGRAERGEAPWPETGLYGNLGRPSPVKRLARPYTPELLELESEVWEKHNRAAGTDTSWAEFFEAALVSYGQDIEAVEMRLEPHVRETLDRDGWRCRVPDCSRRAQLQVHHSLYRSRGGTHEVDQLLCMCEVHHRLVHAGLLLIVGRASTGFRFAHRASLDDGWVFLPGTSLGAEPWDPHAQAFDLDAMADLEPPRPYAVPCDPYWTVREPAWAYGSASDRAITAVITGKNPIAALPPPSRASPAELR